MTQIIKEYAAALFELAKESNSEKEFDGALNLILSQFQNNPEYVQLLSSKNIPFNERKQAFETVFEPYIPEYVLSFTELLCEKGYISEFDKCVKEYKELYKAFESVETAHVLSAVALTPQEKTALILKLEKISGHIVNAEYEIDESLLGGVVVRMDDTVIDGSLKYKLKELKEVIGK